VAMAPRRLVMFMLHENITTGCRGAVAHLFATSCGFRLGISGTFREGSVVTRAPRAGRNGDVVGQERWTQAEAARGASAAPV